MRFRFRTVLVTVTLALLLITVGVIGATSFLSARRMAEDLSGQVLDQTAQRIEDQVRNELELAIGQSRLDAALLASKQIDPLNKDTSSSDSRVRSQGDRSAREATRRGNRGLLRAALGRRDRRAVVCWHGRQGAQLIIDRARAYKDAPPPEGWDGTHRMTSK